MRVAQFTDAFFTKSESRPLVHPVACIVISFNSGHELEKCIASARANNISELIIVDNASIDNALAFLPADIEGLTVVYNKDNIGFAAASNQGAALSTCPYLLFLNDDAFLHQDYVRILLQALTSRIDVAMAVGKLVYDDKEGRRRIDSAGLVLERYALRPQDRGQGALDLGQFDGQSDVFGCTGAAVLIRRDAFFSVGGFDTDLFAYYEDVDLAWRLSQRQWRHLYVPRALAMHGRRGLVGKAPATVRRAFTNRYKVWAKNESLCRFVTYAPIALAWEAARLMRMACRDWRLTWDIISDAPSAIRHGVKKRRRP